MLEQILSRDMITKQVEKLIEVADADGVDAGIDGTVEETHPEASRVLAGLQAASVLPPGARQTPVDRKAFIPRQEQLSLLQALLEERAYEGNLRTVPTEPDGTASTAVVGPAQDAGLPLAQERLQSAKPSPDGEPEGLGDFDMSDPLWAKTAAELILTAGARRRFTLRSSPPRTFDLAPDARVVLVSDWGTGGPAADLVAKAMGEQIRLAGDRKCHVIHLGDVYYAGTNWEAKHRFLDHWPVGTVVQPRPGLHSWCLNGNHDMYAAGQGLLSTTLADDRFSGQRTMDGEPTTQLHLSGGGWQIVGLDTSWSWRLSDLGGLHGALGSPQALWLEGLVPQADHTILLSHHQPFSRVKAHPAPLDKERELLRETYAIRRDHVLDAWFWGHEHRCVTFRRPPEIPGLAYGACIGHGAVPQPIVEESLVGPGEWEMTDTVVDSDGDLWRMCGFAVLDFSPDGPPTVTYVTQHGDVVRGPESL